MPEINEYPQFISLMRIFEPDASRYQHLPILRRQLAAYVSHMPPEILETTLENVKSGLSSDVSLHSPPNAIVTDLFDLISRDNDILVRTLGLLPHENLDEIYTGLRSDLEFLLEKVQQS
jgi:hypothetical protein